MSRGVYQKIAGARKPTDYKESVLVATTGVIANLSAVDTATGIDGVALPEKARVLVQHNASPDGVIAQHGKYKGIYVVGPLLNKAAGSITVVAKASLVDGDYFTLDDGVNDPVVFEFDDDSNVAPGAVAIDLTPLTDAASVRDAVIAAINGVGATLTITASISDTDEVALENDVAGSAGNQAITENVADAGFTVAGMTGGDDEAALTRAEDFDTDEDVTDGAIVPVEQGTQAGKKFILTTNNPITLGTTALTFVDELAALANYQLLSEKGQANGYAGLDGDGKVPLAQLPPALSEEWLTINVTDDVDELDIGDSRYIRLTADDNYAIRSITGTARRILIHNDSGFIITLNDDDPAGTGDPIITRVAAEDGGPNIPLADQELAELTLSASSTWILGRSVEAIGGGGAGGGGQWELVEEIVVTGSDVSSVTFSGLTGNTDKRYKLICYCVGTSGSQVRLKPNDVTANQTTEGKRIAAGTGISTSNIRIGKLNAATGKPSFIVAEIYAAIEGVANPHRRVIADCVDGDNDREVTASLWDNAADEITSLVVDCPDGSGQFKVGSRFVLYKEAAVA